MEDNLETSRLVIANPFNQVKLSGHCCSNLCCRQGPPYKWVDVEKDDLTENLHYKFHTENIPVSNAMEVDWLVPLPVFGELALIGRAFGIGMSHIEVEGIGSIVIRCLPLPLTWGIIPFWRGLQAIDPLTMFINRVLNGMILQVLVNCPRNPFLISSTLKREKTLVRQSKLLVGG